MIRTPVSTCREDWVRLRDLTISVSFYIAGLLGCLDRNSTQIEDLQIQDLMICGHKSLQQASLQRTPFTRNDACYIFQRHLIQIDPSVGKVLDLRRHCPCLLPTRSSCTRYTNPATAPGNSVHLHLAVKSRCPPAVLALKPRSQSLIVECQ